MRVALVTVGDELLSGDTVNTNAAWLGRELDRRGVVVERATVLPDRVSDIARVVNEYRAEFDAVVVTGGLGPTHDDVTMEGVAAAFGRALEEHEEAIAWLREQGGYAADELADGTGALPAGARVVHNDVGVAPGCVIDAVYVLPGVPEEMKAMFETVGDEFEGDRTHEEVVEAAEPESALVDRLRELRERYDVKVGSYPDDHVRVKIRSRDPETARAAAAWLRERVTQPGSNSYR